MVRMLGCLGTTGPLRLLLAASAALALCGCAAIKSGIGKPLAELGLCPVEVAHVAPDCPPEAMEQCPPLPVLAAGDDLRERLVLDTLMYQECRFRHDLLVRCVSAFSTLNEGSSNNGKGER